MKNNVINDQFAIDCHDGSLQIIGTGREAVVFRLSGMTVSDLYRDYPPFCKNAIFTRDIDSRVNVLIFEYNLRGELRNPRKLLKSVRNKLVQASIRNSVEDEKEYNKMYDISAREEHRMFR